MGPAWNMKQASIWTKAWVQKGINQEVQECSEITSPDLSDFRANVQRLLHVPFSSHWIQKAQEGTAICGWWKIPGLTLSPSKSKWARKITASPTGTSSFLYKIWKTRLCTVLSWTQAERRLPLSAKQEPVGAHDFRPALIGSLLVGQSSSRKTVAPNCTPIPKDQKPQMNVIPSQKIYGHWIRLASQKEPSSVLL